MSDTPRVDEFLDKWSKIFPSLPQKADLYTEKPVAFIELYGLARQLERELNEARRKYDTCKTVRDFAALKAGISIQDIRDLSNALEHETKL
jgi:hypothetical protein